MITIKRLVVFVFLISHAFLSLISAETEQSRLKILTPSFCHRETGSIRLDNGLEAFLISDSKASKSAAAMCVHVGIWDNPEDAMGMAHFVEHMLFLGTDEYPEEGAFQRFVVQNGGDYNAFTTSDTTCYLFSIESAAYFEGLHRLASFFKKPLFTASCTERELKAVDGEFSATTKNDLRRCNAVMRDLSNPEHPFSRFGAGNKKSLAHVSTEHLRKWYDAHYSANLMRLIVYSPLPLNELKELVKKNFGSIDNKELAWNPPEEPFLSTAEGKIAYVQSIQDRRLLKLQWELSATSIKYDAKPEDITAYLLGHEGPQSISSHLKAQNLATQVSAFAYCLGGKNYLFCLNVDLAEKGLKDLDAVIETCFEGIQSARKADLPRYLYDDRRRISELAYQYQQRSDPFETMNQYAWMIFAEELDTFPEHSLVIQRFDPEAIKEILDQLTPERLFAVVNTDLAGIGKTADRVEEWLHVPYTIEPLSEVLLQRLRKVEGNTFTLPRANQWLPNDLALIHHQTSSHRPERPVPVTVWHDDGGRVYHSADEQFEVPETYCKFLIRSPELSLGDAKKAVLSQLYLLLVNRHLSQLTEETGQAGLHYSLDQRPKGLVLEVTGYSEMTLALLQELVTSMRNLHPEPDEFLALKNKLALDNRDQFKTSPLLQAKDMATHLLIQAQCSNAQKNAVINAITLQELTTFIQSIYDRTYIEGLVYGNLSSEQSVNAYKNIRQTIGGQSWPLEEQNPVSIVDLPLDQLPVAVESVTTHPHDAVMLFIQCADATESTRAASAILNKAIEVPFFKRLRTEQQTAYSLHCWTTELEKQPIVFLALESSNYTADVILERFEAFLESYASTLESTLSETEFAGIKRALLAEMETPAQNLQEMGTLLHGIAFDNNGKWDEFDQIKAALEKLSYKEFCRIARETLQKPNQRRLALIVRGKPGSALQGPYQVSHNTEEVKKGLKYTGRPSGREFQHD